MSESLDNEKQFFEGLDDKLGQFCKDLEASPVIEEYNLKNYLKNNKDRFIDEKFFASGATKKVYSVLETSTERKIALARPHENDEDTANSFLREARRTALLEHPNIVRVYDLGVDEQGPWFTMEFIEGISLQEKIAQIHIGEIECELYDRLEIFNNICDAMTYAHSIGILHLDIKPDNIRVGEYGEILLCDWGLSHLDYSESIKADLSNDKTLHGMVKGTPGYMAPERIHGEKSVQSDVFSLGALLFALLTYRPPFEGNSVEEIIIQTLEGKFDFPDNSTIPERLVPVIKKALSSSLSDRYQSVKELQEEVDKYRSGFATSAENPSLMTQMKLFYSRNRGVCILAFCFVAIIIFLTIRHIQLMNEEQYKLRRAQQETEEAFELYVKEEKARDELMGRFSSSLIGRSRVELAKFNTQSSLNLLYKSLDNDPSNEYILIQLGLVHFIRQEFKQAYKFFSLTSSLKNEDLKTISRQYENTEGLLPARDLIDIISQIKRKYFYLYMFVYYAENQQDHQQVIELIKYLVKKVNKLDDLNFKYDEKNKRLILRDNPKLQRLIPDYKRNLKDSCLLRYLNINHLDLSNTEFINLKDLRGLNLFSLNLKGVPITSLEELRDIPTLRKVFVSKNQRETLKGKYKFNLIFE